VACSTEIMPVQSERKQWARSETDFTAHPLTV